MSARKPPSEVSALDAGFPGTGVIWIPVKIQGHSHVLNGNAHVRRLDASLALAEATIGRTNCKPCSRRVLLSAIAVAI